MGSLDGDNQSISDKEDTAHFIDKAQGEYLLRIARSAIKHYLRDGKLPGNKKGESSLPIATGIFVTLWKNGPIRESGSYAETSTLRGCIGHLQSDLPLFDFIQEVAIGAATRDPRFPPLTPAELNNVRIEIAVLSPLRPINDLQQVTIGEDGLLLEGLGKRGLLLPKVAVRMGWDNQSFLDGVCKAGLPLDCWPASCNLYAFTSLVFDEANMAAQ